MLQFVRDHLTLLLSATGAIYLAIRLFAVSGGSAETYSIILQTQGTGTVVFSAVLGLVPSIPIYLVAGWVMWRTFTVGRLSSKDVIPILGAIAISLIISPLIVIAIPLAIAVVVGALVTVVAIARRLGERVARAARGSLRHSQHTRDLDPGGSILDEAQSMSQSRIAKLEAGAKVLDEVGGEMENLLLALEKRNPESARNVANRVGVLQGRLSNVDDPDLLILRASQESQLKRLRRFAVLAIVLPQIRTFMLRVSLPTWAFLMIFALAIVDGPWLPLERVETPGGPVVGYVLESDDNELILLRDDPRRVFRIEEVLDRTYCSSSDWSVPGGLQDFALRPLLLPNSSAGYPACE